MFRFRPPFALLRYVLAGVVTVVPSESSATIQFNFRLVELLIPSSIGIAFAFIGLSMTEGLWRWICISIAIYATFHAALEYGLARARISKALRAVAHRLAAAQRESG